MTRTTHALRIPAFHSTRRRGSVLLQGNGRSQVGLPHACLVVAGTSHGGPIAKPRHILVVPELPKTRSGKIMRRLLKDVAEGREVGDATTLADNTVMTQIAESMRDPRAAEC